MVVALAERDDTASCTDEILAANPDGEGEEWRRRPRKPKTLVDKARSRRRRPRAPRSSGTTSSSSDPWRRPSRRFSSPASIRPPAWSSRWPVRGRLRVPAPRRVHFRGGRRPARPQGRLPGHCQPDGRCDLPDRCAADLRQAGIARPDPAHLLRIFQGIALGGEYGGAAIYVAEHAPPTSAARRPAGSRHGLARPDRRAAGDPRHAHHRSASSLRLAWGWRIPFLVSSSCSSSRSGFASSCRRAPPSEAQGEGDVCKAPLREAFGRWDNLKRVLIALFGIMSAQGAVWYLSFFYVQFFLERSWASRADQGRAGDRDDRGQRAALRLLRLAVGPRRPQAGDDRRMMLGARRLFPASTTWPAANPALVEAQADAQPVR